MKNIKKKYEYPLTFNDVLAKIFNSNDKLWFQGEEFEDGTIICLQNSSIQAVKFNNNNSPFMWTFRLTPGLYRMKYRRVYTQKDAMREL